MQAAKAMEFTSVLRCLDTGEFYLVTSRTHWDHPATEFQEFIGPLPEDKVKDTRTIGPITAAMLADCGAPVHDKDSDHFTALTLLPWEEVYLLSSYPVPDADVGR